MSEAAPDAFRPMSAGSQQEGQTPLKIEPPAGTAGTAVRIAMDGLPPNTGFVVGFGGIGAPHEILAQAETDGQGRLAVTAAVPSWVERYGAYVFYWAFADMRPRGFSEPFLVSDDDGVVRVQGTIIEERTGGCPTLRGPHDALFALAGNAAALKPGDRVAVEARIATSRCGDRTTLAVRSARPQSGDVRPVPTSSG